MPSSESPTPQPVDAAAQAEILAQRPNLDTCPRCRRSYVRLFGLSPDHHWPVDAGEVIGHYCGLCCSFISGHGPTPQISAEVTATVAITQSDDAAGVGSSPAGEKRRPDFQCKKCGGTEYWVSYVPDGLPPTVAMCNACSPLDPEDLMPEQEANPDFTPEPVPESVREPADPSQPWREVWARDADADPEPFEPTGEGPLTDLLMYELVKGIRYDRERTRRPRPRPGVPRLAASGRRRPSRLPGLGRGPTGRPPGRPPGHRRAGISVPHLRLSGRPAGAPHQRTARRPVLLMAGTAPAQRGAPRHRRPGAADPMAPLLRRRWRCPIHR